MLIPALRHDIALREKFFSRLQVIFHAAASLPQHWWEALEDLSQQTTGTHIPLVAAWGSTETAPLVTSCHFRAAKAGVIGLPVSGCELKLVPLGPKLEARVKGPQVTPGYWKEPTVPANSFDEEGYYLIGDAVRWVDSQHAEYGYFLTAAWRRISNLPPVLGSTQVRFALKH